MTEFRCPNCGKYFAPVLVRKHPDLLIQEEFPDAPSWQREQHISHLCSNKCWNQFLGTDPDARMRDHLRS